MLNSYAYYKKERFVALVKLIVERLSFLDNLADSIWQCFNHSQSAQLPPHHHGLCTDLFPLFQDHPVPAIGLIRGCHVVDRLVIPLVIVIIHPLLICTLF